MTYILSHVHSYQYVLIAFVIIRVALQEYQEYNKLANDISLTTQCYNESLKFSVLSQKSAYVLLKSDKIYLLKTNETGCIVVYS